MQVFQRFIWNQPYALLLLTITFWCGNFVVGEFTTKTSADPIPPVQLAFVRWLCAAIVLLPFAWRGLMAERAVIKTHILSLWIIGVSAYAFYNTCIYLALSEPSADATSLATLQTIFPAVVAVLALLLFGGALALGARGRRFESSRPDQSCIKADARARILVFFENLEAFLSISCLTPGHFFARAIPIDLDPC